MKLNHKIIASCVLLTLTSFGFSQNTSEIYPQRTLQLHVPFGLGGTTDLMARLLQDELAKPDGYTIAMTTTGPQTLQPSRREAPPYTPQDFDYICGTYDVAVLAAGQGVDAVAVPYKSTGDMILPFKTQQINMFSETPPIATQYQLRALLALSDTPVAGFEQVPTAKSLGISSRAQTANNPLVYRTGADFKAFSLAEYEKFKAVVKTHGLM